jgi:isoamylase
MRAMPGRPYPLGATWDGAGVNFALFSEHATHVELCLFDSPGATEESARILLPEQTDHVWHVYLPDVVPDQLYGYRVHGPHDPAAGHRFNPKKVVLDPYAKAIGRDLRWHDSLFGYRLGDPATDLSLDDRDSAGFAPLAAVIDPAFTWGDDRPLRIPWHKTIIYEMHVKGFTKAHPAIPEKARGTFAGLASDASIRHLVGLGVTAVELMPVHHHVDDRTLVERGLTNYWGYNTLAYFAPDLRFSSIQAPRDSVNQFKMMVRSLHAAGLEVILDVVYNHTAEGNHLGPTLSLRGIDNASYYRLCPEDPRHYTDYTGCGNTLQMRNPRVLQLIMDSLRYWVLEMHVDGFRFDLASTLARELHAVNKLGAFFDIIHQDPILSQVKLIAEPWDVGEGGYQVGNFPVLWTEWNGKYRDSIRQFWKGGGLGVADLATRLSGSSDLYEQSSRRPYASINFVTCHDGFTLEDLVSYNEKHNEANGEGNGDGSNENLSSNYGTEGPAEDPAVRTIRERQKRNLLATLILSQGVPMISMGDELGRSQGGNNNAYCQDDPMAWINWDLTPENQKFLEFVRWVLKLRKEQPVFQRRKFFQGRKIRGADIKDISWLGPGGVEMTDEVWNSSAVRCLGMRLAGDLIGDVSATGERIVGDTIAVLLNAHGEPIPFTLPRHDSLHQWEILLDTARPEPEPRPAPRGVPYEIQGGSLVILRLQTIPVEPLTVHAALDSAGSVSKEGSLETLQSVPAPQESISQS